LRNTDWSWRVTAPDAPGPPLRPNTPEDGPRRLPSRVRSARRRTFQPSDRIAKDPPPTRRDRPEPHPEGLRSGRYEESR
jgi:hypothetical protein